MQIDGHQGVTFLFNLANQAFNFVFFEKQFLGANIVGVDVARRSVQRVDLATDDINCLEYARQFFGSKLNSISSPPQCSDDKALIYNNHGIDLQKFYNKNSLIELLVAASAKEFHVTYIHSYKQMPLKKGSISGFILLAKKLHEDITVLNELLGK
jgi:hypothetical protein